MALVQHFHLCFFFPKLRRNIHSWLIHLNHITLTTLSRAAFSKLSFAAASFCSRSVSRCACENKEEKANVIYTVIFHPIIFHAAPERRNVNFVSNIYELIQKCLPKDKRTLFSLKKMCISMCEKIIFKYLIILFIYLTSISNSAQDFVVLNKILKST